eukprot:8919379-Pyramimonas_sp.AAC.1
MSAHAGSVRKRPMLDNILCLEADVLEQACHRGEPNAGLLLLDFRAALPSLRRVWILDLLYSMSMPMYFANAIRFMCANIQTTLALRGEVFAW